MRWLPKSAKKASNCSRPYSCFPPTRREAGITAPYSTGISDSVLLLPLLLHVFGEHLLRIDHDKDASAARKNFPFFIGDFGGVDVLAFLNRNFPAFDTQRLLQRHWLEVFNRHLAGERDNVAQFIDLAHSVVEDGGDDAAVAVAGRSAIALGQAKAADKGLPGFIQRKLEVHTVRIVRAAGEAIIFLRAVMRIVSVRLARHGGILTDQSDRRCRLDSAVPRSQE